MFEYLLMYIHITYTPHCSGLISLTSYRNKWPDVITIYVAIHSITRKIQLEMLNLEAAKQIHWARITSIVLSVFTFLISIWVFVVGHKYCANYRDSPTNLWRAVVFVYICTCTYIRTVLWWAN